MKKYYIHSMIRAFCNINNAVDILLQADRQSQACEYHYKLYDTFEEAYKYCSKITDGYTEMVMAIEILHYNKDFDFYCVALETPQLKRKYRERRVILLNRKTYNEVFEIKGNE